MKSAWTTNSVIHDCSDGCRRFDYLLKPLNAYCGCVCLTAAGKSTFVRLLQGASEEWEVIPEPIGKWCNVQKDGDDIYQVNNATVDFGAALMGLSLFDGPACLS